MPIQEVGAGSQRNSNTLNNGDSFTVAYPADVTIGNLLVVAGRTFTSSDTHTTTVSDTRTNTWAIFLGPLVNKSRGFVAFAIANSSGPCTVTVDPSDASGCYGGAAVDEFSGVRRLYPAAIAANYSTGSGTAVSDDITTLLRENLIIGDMGFAEFSNVTLTPGANYTQIGEFENAAATIAYNAVFRIVTAPSTYTVDWTAGSSVSWDAITIAFAAEPTVIRLQDEIHTTARNETPVIDDFNRADNASLGTNWTEAIVTTHSGMNILDNGASVDASGPTICSAWFNPFLWGPDVEVAADYNRGGSPFLTLYARIVSPGTASVSGYKVAFSQTSNYVRLYRIDNAVDTQLATVTITPAAGAALKLRIIDKTLYALYRAASETNWQVVLTANDATYTAAGYVGLAMTGTSGAGGPYANFFAAKTINIARPRVVQFAPAHIIDL